MRLLLLDHNLTHLSPNLIILIELTSLSVLFFVFVIDLMAEVIRVSVIDLSASESRQRADTGGWSFSGELVLVT